MTKSSRWILAAAALLTGAATSGFAQVQASLTVDALAHALKAGDSATAKLTLDIDPGWHIYALQVAGDSIPTEIVLGEKQSVAIAGPIAASPAAVDEKFETQVVFSIPLKATAALTAGSKISFSVTYQACNDQNCLPPAKIKAETP